MPTPEEFEGLAALDSGWNDTNKGYRLTDENDNSIFLPAAGFGYGTDLSDAGDIGNYWSSSLFSGNPYYAYYLNFYDGNIEAATADDRCYGFSVRPLSE